MGEMLTGMRGGGKTLPRGAVRSIKITEHHFGITDIEGVTSFYDQADRESHIWIRMKFKRGSATSLINFEIDPLNKLIVAGAAGGRPNEKDILKVSDIVFDGTNISFYITMDIYSSVYNTYSRVECLISGYFKADDVYTVPDGFKN